jgi:penicillin-binding protein-related factor A (putative recombinase)
MGYKHFKKILFARITDEQYEHLKKESKRDKVSFSVIVRWALDERYNLEVR